MFSIGGRAESGRTSGKAACIVYLMRRSWLELSPQKICREDVTVQQDRTPNKFPNLAQYPSSFSMFSPMRSARYYTPQTSDHQKNTTLNLPAIYAPLWFMLLVTVSSLSAAAPRQSLTTTFQSQVHPVLDLYCYDCHSEDIREGGLSLESFETESDLGDPELWLKVLKKVRAGLMPPLGEGELLPVEKELVSNWIKSEVFQSDPLHPDPGHVTLRRLNKVEYRNTILDLTGVDYDTALEFPADDSGEGFDNLGEVLTVSPLLLEKYFDAAQAIVADAVAHYGLAAFAPARLEAKLPADPVNRHAYSRQLLGSFASRAFRRPVNPSTLERLIEFAEEKSATTGTLDETGIIQSLVAILASPRFIYRIENPAPASPQVPYPLIDEYALATRLSYFFWSTMPDEELFNLARVGELRNNLDAQLSRLLQSPRAGQFIENFVGQWLHSRDIIGAPIDDIIGFLPENAPPEVVAAHKTVTDLRNVVLRTRTPEQQKIVDDGTKIVVAHGIDPPLTKFPAPIRKAMRLETEMQFAHILMENRSVLELLDCDYTFLNEVLARHYGIEGVFGPEMRKVTLPSGSPRGGILTQGTILATTSNPTRTSPVNRGVFILDNILGTPPAPPPPNIPALEDVASEEELAKMTLRQTLELHRADPLCASCHKSMDPLGLALENFNSMGQWRDHDRGEAINPSGKLVTGESFDTLSELKTILSTDRQREFYYCVSEKLLMYALGRSLDYYDTVTLDRLVARLEETNGTLRTLIRDIIKSAPFQRMRPALANQSTPTLAANQPPYTRLVP